MITVVCSFISAIRILMRTEKEEKAEAALNGRSSSYVVRASVD